MKGRAEVLDILQTFFDNTTSLSSTVWLSSIPFFCLTYKGNDGSTFERRTKMFHNKNNHNDSPIVKNDNPFLNLLIDNNGEISLLERFNSVGDIQARLEKLIISCMETKNYGSCFVYVKTKKQIFGEVRPYFL